MAKIRDPVRFSTHFGLQPTRLENAGAVDPTLNADLRLFIDPLLIAKSRVADFRVSAARRIREFFEEIITLLAASRRPGDVSWREARRRMSFREVSGTCLGYGAATIRGSGMGAKTTNRVVQTAKEIVDLGVRDPDLFLLLPLLEEGVGPDLISDMVTNIIQPDLAAFTVRVLDGQSLPTQPSVLRGTIHRLPRNPCFKTPIPVLLVPRDILDELPVALDQEDVERVVAHNRQLRERVNRHIAGIWDAKTRRDKRELRSEAPRPLRHWSHCWISSRELRENHTT